MNEEQLLYCKVRKVESPRRAHCYDAGIDFFVPTDLTESDVEAKCTITGSKVDFTVSPEKTITTFTINPGASILIPSGIKVKVPKYYMLQFANKSGVASKQHLLVGASVVDYGYEGECHINLHNVGSTPTTISAGDKLVQAILIPIACPAPVMVEDPTVLYGKADSMTTDPSSRGSGGFGSSGTR